MRHWEGQRRAEPLPPADEQQLELIRRGSPEWNEWRTQNPTVIPLLFGADLKGSNLSGCDLSNARLDGADLTDASLRRARLHDATLFEAVLYGANLEHAELSGTDLRDADLLMAQASKTVFTGVEARGARFAGAIVQDAQLSGTDFRETDFREAELQRSDMRRVKLDGAVLWTTRLDDADLRDATGMRFDETTLRGTKFSPRSPDRWSVLRRHYTGPRYAITLILLVAFVLPYFAKAAGWVAAARVQHTVGVALIEAEDRIEGLVEVDAPGAAVASEILRSVQARMPNEEGGGWRTARVWELLLGVDKGIWYFLATCVLLTYNVLRGLLTWVVGPMRDAEERSGVSPPHRVDGRTTLERFLRWLKGGWAESYAWLWIPHRTVTVLFAVAAASFLFHAVTWLGLVVWLPS